ncbi:metallophosphoesterase family protein [Tundrisphaera sp. TA3]|uniref:metallophosphoesterase family protein n=1 Tax=Tundrisphaera sp. TA3 TaxID=3435775 RepID=UPI003EBA02A4
MFTFLHAADIHLDSPLRGLDRYEGCPADEIRGATRRALANLVKLAIDEKVAFVLIAGDVYDGDWRDHNTGLWFVRQMSILRDAGIDVFLISGNHDAKNKMTRELRLPDNVTTLSTDRPESRRTRDGSAAIHGQGFATAAVTEDLSATYPAAVPGCFNVGMLHTSATGREGHERYAPCTVDSLRSKGYGYWALGHVHAREVLDARDAPIVFPGNVQGRHIGEEGAKGCMLVTVDDAGAATTEFRPLDVLRWAMCRIDASAARSPDDVVDAFQDQIAGLLDAADRRHLAVRVRVSGATAAHSVLVARAEDWSNDIRSVAISHGADRIWVESVKVRTSPPRRAKGSDPGADGPLAELDLIIADLLGDESRLVAFAGDQLGDLRKKLPPELIRSDAVDLADPRWLRHELEHARALLEARFDAAAEAAR